MTIQQPPNDELPPTAPGDEQPSDAPIDTPQEPEQRAPGADEPSLGVPRDEPDPDMA